MGKGILTGILLVSLLTVATAAEKGRADPAPQAATGITGRLPVKRVVLYKSGIGYFEHSARVRGNQELSIDFTTAQLNDGLKSLTVVDLTEGRITGVRYNSIAPVSERLKTLRLPLGDQTTRADFLNALRGAWVEVRSGAALAAGRMMSVEKVRRPSPKSELVMESTELVIVTDAGELRSFDVAAAKRATGPWGGKGQRQDIGAKLVSDSAVQVIAFQ